VEEVTRKLLFEVRLLHFNQKIKVIKIVKKSKLRLAGAFVHALRRVVPKKIYVSAVILAAGSGTRMNAGVTKQWLELRGRPLFAASLAQFQLCPKIKEIILCVKEDEKELFADVRERYGITKLKAVVVGGNTRADSALCGFKKISDKATHVAIHDASRCLVTPEMIDAVIKKAVLYGSATAACRATDTVKLATEDDLILSTPDRKTVWQAQTPQIFETEIYRASAYLAREKGIEVTDDCSMVENAGFKIKLVDCGKENLKITEPIDLYFAEAVLKMQSDTMKREHRKAKI